MRHAVAHSEQARHSSQSSLCPAEYAARRARISGKLFAVRWPEVREQMPEGATIGDYRIKCEADWREAQLFPERTLGAFLDGFNAEVAHCAKHRMPGFEDAREVLVAEARMYEQQAEEAALAYEAAWRAIEEVRRADEEAQQRAERAIKAALVVSA
ncbi:hypothetical protein [Ralstonia pseudosolanacearum]|uniref:hypothetical protein n=1 Tax=Ralstonia pseudosolanacearum TaxID=1310165 RepID=UPI00267620C0|nr:hypothetical protein [Ralstonia pseudosolanacearum]MDO3506051.1 hypothetical protein [Ralstonia pseudosolanacearum]MDO3510381.1 hypothetical protein [Ralstonia pseudosolanacearum]MDO3535927.1 hypothetical protein [Ralstonia pseudosolanacearum]MDO3606205.1 hypothetical protein [Ralstonia pseudosolanacearum]MDO3611139.1 hypothetical protein [Ralstonia pseudosolanacearum]